MLVGSFFASFDAVAALQWNKNMVMAAGSTHVVPGNQELRALCASISPSMSGAALVSAIEQLNQKAVLINNDSQGEQVKKHLLLSLIVPVASHLRGQLVASLENIDRQIKVLTYNRDHSIKRYFFQIPTQWKHNAPEAIQAQLADLHTRRNQMLTVLSGMTDVIATFNGAIDSNGLSRWINTLLSTTAPLMRSAYNATPLFSVALQNMSVAIVGMNRFSSEISALCVSARMMNHMHTGYRYFKPVVIGALAVVGSYLGYQWANRKIDAVATTNNIDPLTGDPLAVSMVRAQLVADTKDLARQLRDIRVIDRSDEYIDRNAETDTLNFLENELLHEFTQRRVDTQDVRHAPAPANNPDESMNVFPIPTWAGFRALFPDRAQNIENALANNAVMRAQDAMRYLPEILRLIATAHRERFNNVVHGAKLQTMQTARLGSKVAFGGFAASALIYSLYTMATVKSTQYKETIAQQLASIQDMLMHVDNVAQLDAVMRGELMYRAALIDDATSSYGNERIGNCLSVLYDSTKSPFNKMKAAELIGQLVKPA
jgi:hypothetical protein